jgi:hypothetical protein
MAHFEQAAFNDYPEGQIITSEGNDFSYSSEAMTLPQGNDFFLPPEAMTYKINNKQCKTTSGQ